jgi:ADP-ribosylglycohydrolase/fructose-1,6-bisphosphatase/inositol monophosphatase family enzyme
MDLRNALETAMAAAREAGTILRNDFHRPGGPRGSGDKAEADLEAERVVRARLIASFGSWGYLGEETGRVDGDAGAPVWVVDPNDGTRDYLAGRRGSAVSIGLIAQRRPVLGVVFAFGYPDDDGDMFAWAEGAGPLTRNGRPVETRLGEALFALDVVLVSSKGDRDPDTNLQCASPARYRTVPSIAHRLALLAAGEAAAVTSLYGPCSWDYGAGHALVRAAGGVLVDEVGKEITYDDSGWSQAREAYAGAAEVVRVLAERPWSTGNTGPWVGDRPARLRPGAACPDARRLARAQGCLLGQVAGDSLGSLVEFASAAEVATRYPDGPRLLEDGGVWHTLAGQPTDDSEMALALARSITDLGRFDAADVVRAYREWYRTGPFDVGQTTRAALVGYLVGDSKANGSLMRSSPLGIFTHALTAAEAAVLAREDSALTHPNLVCGDAVAAYVAAVGHAVREGDGPRAAYEAALAWARAAGAQPSVMEALEAAAREAPVCDGDQQGFVLVALQNAFHALLHAPSLEEGVVATIRRGGDTDTNAAIAGALLGAVHGRAAVPSQWYQMVLSCRAHPLRARHARPLRFWPVDVLELAELLLVSGAETPSRSGRTAGGGDSRA